MTNETPYSYAGYNNNPLNNFLNKTKTIDGTSSDKRTDYNREDIQVFLKSLGKSIEINDIQQLKDGRVLMPYTDNNNNLIVFIFGNKPKGADWTGKSSEYLIWVDIFKNGKHIGQEEGELFTEPESYKKLFDKYLGKTQQYEVGNESAPRKNLLNEARIISELLIGSDGPGSKIEKRKKLNGFHEINKELGDGAKWKRKGNFKNGELDGNNCIEEYYGHNIKAEPGVNKVTREGYFENGILINGLEIHLYNNGKKRIIEIKSKNVIKSYWK